MFGSAVCLLPNDDSTAPSSHDSRDQYHRRLLWLHGNHSFEFGTNIRIVSETSARLLPLRSTTAITNQSFYVRPGAILRNAINQSLPGLTGLPVGTL